jgi:hypothetical protein
LGGGAEIAETAQPNARQLTPIRANLDKARIDSSLNRRGQQWPLVRAVSEIERPFAAAQNAPLASRNDWISAEEYKILASHATEV